MTDYLFPPTVARLIRDGAWVTAPLVDGGAEAELAGASSVDGGPFARAPRASASSGVLASVPSVWEAAAAPPPPAEEASPAHKRARHETSGALPPDSDDGGTAAAAAAAAAAAVVSLKLACHLEGGVAAVLCAALGGGGTRYWAGRQGAAEVAAALACGPQQPVQLPTDELLRLLAGSVAPGSEGGPVAVVGEWLGTAAEARACGVAPRRVGVADLLRPETAAAAKRVTLLLRLRATVPVMDGVALPLTYTLACRPLLHQPPPARAPGPAPSAAALREALLRELTLEPQRALLMAAAEALLALSAVAGVSPAALAARMREAYQARLAAAAAAAHPQTPARGVLEAQADAAAAWLLGSGPPAPLPPPLQPVADIATDVLRLARREPQSLLSVAGLHLPASASPGRPSDAAAASYANETGTGRATADPTSTAHTADADLQRGRAAPQSPARAANDQDGTPPPPPPPPAPEQSRAKKLRKAFL